MSARAYLSIGDVLTLLREEFPDVTISKIRFLESQGLVNPERSPSGYRKFYDHDVERLRWVLRQQREHFLPLRVIRDRLARAGNGVPVDEPEPSITADEGPDAVREATRSEVGRAPVAARVATSVSATRMAPDGGGNGAAYPDEGSWTVPGDERRPVAAAKEAGIGPPSGHEAVLDSGTWASVERETERPPDEAAGAPGEPGSGSAPAHAAPEPTTPPPAHPPAHVAGTDAPPAGPAAPEPADRGQEGSAVGRGSSTLEELCEASGLPRADIASLESYGLIEPVTVGGATYYDEEAVTVAQLAAELARYGIEPRHLRLYRNAIDREVGLVEQVVLPLLRQRNPAARQRAVDAAAELTRIGESLRASLLRRELRRHLGG